MNTILSGAVSLLIFVAMLGVLVFVHELGHFVVSKRLGIPVLEFGFGFPPRIWRFRKDNGWIEIQGRRIVIPRTFALPQNVTVGSRVLYKSTTEADRETLSSIQVVDDDTQGTGLASPVQALDRGTEYTVNAIPLGGFVRLMGEEDPSVPGGFASARPIVRAPVLLAGVTMNFVLAFLVFAATAFFMPPYINVQTTRVAAVAENSPAALVGLRVGDTIAAVNAEDVKDNFPRLSQALRQNAGREITLTVIRNNQTLDPIKTVPRASPPRNEGPLGIALSGWLGLHVTSVEPGSVADRAGVLPGDAFVFIVDSNNQTLRDQNQLAEFVKAHPGWKIDLRIARDNKLIGPLTVQIPEAVDAANETLGLNLKTSIVDAPGKAVQEMWQVVASIPPMVGQLFAGTAPANAFVGPLGIYQVTGEVAQRGGPLALLELLGLLSLNLAIVNLLPFPALDGGRMVFVVLEWLRGGKKIDPQKEGLVHLVGIAVLIGLMILISFSDVQRLISGQPILPAP